MGEEDDDDESFGDFTFASFPSQPLSSTSNDTNPVVNDNNDDDWGDFMNHSNNQINANFSKPFDPFAASPDPPKKHVNDKNGVVVQAESVKTTKGGAIPLSIFGEEEEEESAPAPASSNVFSKGGAAKTGSGSNGSVGIGDLISSLYNQHQPQIDSSSHNGSVPVSNVAALNPTSSNVSKLNEDEDDDDDGWEFKSAEWESGNKDQDVKAEVPKHDNGALDVGTVLDASNGVSDKAGGWDLDFEFSPISASQNHISSQPGSKSESNDVETGFAVFSQNFGELSSGPGSNQNSKVPKEADIYHTNMGLFQFDGATPHGTVEKSQAAESHQSDEWNFGFNFNSSSGVGDSHSSESYFKNTTNQDDNNKIDAFPTNLNVDSDVNLFESMSADTRHEKPLTSSENRRQALSLSIFGDETPDTDEHPVSQDLSTYTSTSPIRKSFNSPGSDLPINEMIWNLYNQAGSQTSNVTPKASENQIHASPEVSGSSLITGGDDFDDDSWDFKDALAETRFTHESVQETSFDHAPQVNEKGLQSSPTVINSDLTNGDDFEDDSWEFKDAISETRSQDHTSPHYSADHQELSTESEQIDHVEFFSKLKDELCNCVLFHLQNLKRTQNAAALLGEDDKEKALQEEIQEFSKILHQDNMGIPNEYISGDYFPRNVHFDELLEVLKEPKFQPVESEYQLASRLLMAERDIKCAIELLKETASTLRLLKLESAEVQSKYLIIWSKIASVCSQELKHGAYVWKQAVLQNIHDQILSNQKGAQYILALGEIYRVAAIIRASAKLLRPWMLSGSIDPKSFSALLDECYSIWLASGLEEALLSVSNQNNFEPDDISRELVESIKYIHELDEHALQRYVISGEQTTCQLSALPAGFIPGLNLVTWNGKHYFVKLANLWVNLISSDPPKE